MFLRYCCKMNRLFIISTIFIFLFGCQKSNIESNIGEWDFEVVYTDFEAKESIFNCVGEIVKQQSKLIIHHCISDFIEISIKKDGSIYSNKSELIGLIDSGSCIVVIDDPNERTIDKITIRGEKINEL